MRKNRVLVAAMAGLTLVFSSTPGAQADDPAADQAVVEQQLAASNTAVMESTEAVAAASLAVQEVNSRLTESRATLESIRVDLVSAEAADKRLAAELTAAQADESAAEGKLVEIQAEIDQNDDTMTALVRSVYQGGTVLQATALLDSRSFEELTYRSNTLQQVTQSHSTLADLLADARARQSSVRAEAEAARERTAAARAETAATLREKQLLEQRAVAVTAEIERLHDERTLVLAEAEATLADDEAEYLALQAERARLEEALRERAAAQAAAAEAAAKATAESTADETHQHDAQPAPPASSGEFYRPVEGWITSPYGWRTHPISGLRKFHDGTDFGAACGTPIRAAASGTVLSAYYAGGYGNQTVIEHGSIDGNYVVTSYNHQLRFAVSPGQVVDRGQVIGYVGTTGYSTGCHLHFSVFVNGSTTDPMNYLQ